MELALLILFGMEVNVLRTPIPNLLLFQFQQLVLILILYKLLLTNLYKLFVKLDIIIIVELVFLLMGDLYVLVHVNGMDNNVLIKQLQALQTNNLLHSIDFIKEYKPMNLKIKVIEEDHEIKDLIQIIDIKVDNQLFVQIIIVMMEIHVYLFLEN